MSEFLLLLAVDWEMRGIIRRAEKRTATLEDHDFADSIVLVSSKYEHLQNLIHKLVNNARRVGLKTQSHGNKCTKKGQSEDWK